MSVDLEESRRKLNEIDEQLADLFDKRMRITMDVAAYKQEHGKPIYDAAREAQVIERARQRFPYRSEEFRRELGTFFQTVMDLSKEQQAREIRTENVLHTAYYGVPGSFTHEALGLLYGSGTIEKNYLSCEEIFRAVAEGSADYGIVPAENSTTGIIYDVYDCLAKYPVYIVREDVLSITQNLLVIPGTQLSDIKNVYSHAQGFAQSSVFLANHPDWTQIPYYNTAKSAEHVAELGDRANACIAGIKCAELYGLEPLVTRIQDRDKNFTRFYAIARTIQQHEDANTLSLYVKLRHEPGSLYRMLSVFAKYDLNMLKIESRPIPGQIWEYGFYIDAQGNVEDPKVQEALREIRPLCLEWKLLGNYIGQRVIAYDEKSNGLH